MVKSLGNTEQDHSSKSGLMLEVREITKKFGDLVANDKVDFTIGHGEIHALLGENGAGKSTLVKMLYGSLQPNGGEIIWHGQPVQISSPSAARQIGIGMVFQHFSLFDSLSVADNIALSLDGGFSPAEIGEKALELSHSYGLPLNPDSIVGDLSVGERQRVEIVRCLLQNPQLIILDEPTSVLTPQEADNLFVTLERLKSEGRSILYISHRLDEVRRLCDRATVLRHGKVVGECDPSKETASSLANMMVGGEVEDISRQTGNAKGDEILLELKGISVPSASPFAMSLKNINLEMYGGQLLGIAGVAGNGQSEFFDLVSGEITIAENDKITMRGNAVGTVGINGRRQLGAAFVPEERLGHSAVPDLKLSENLLLARHVSDNAAFTGLGAIRYIMNEQLQQATKRICEVMDVRKSGTDPAASSLSGGNLQKFIMGRELDRQPSIMVVNQPTWGVDAGAAARVRQALIDLARSGSCVIVISQDLDEIFEISDVISVMSDGHLSKPEDASNMTREEIGLLMGGMADNDMDSAGVANAH